jgi:uncharacterized protein YecE (DUF72 family)
LTADFVYLRLHGSEELYVYFDNDAKVRAPVDARSLRGKLAEFT